MLRYVKIRGGKFMDVFSEDVISLQGMKLHVVPTKKYKTNTIIFKMKTPINKETVTKRALLPYVLQSNTKQFPTTAKLRTYLDELYGTLFYVDVGKKGEYHILSFTVEIANEIYLSDQTPLLEKGFAFLKEVLLNPNTNAGAFDQSTVENEKRTLKQRIQSVYNDKMKYSNFRLIQEMCKNEPYAQYVHGELDDVDSITAQNLYEYYEQSFAEDELDLFVIGDIEEEKVKKIVSDFFQFPVREAKRIEQRSMNKRNEVKEIIENQNVKQGKLNIGYRTNIFYGDDDYFALQVFNGIFGGFSHSKLFINVREKASLAYYVASRLESHKGLMLVMSGIDNKNYDQAVSIIKEQMNAMINGDFTEEEISQTKSVSKNQLLETLDNARGMVEVLYHNVVSGKTILLQSWITNMDQVSKKEIVQTAKKIHMDTIYFLTEGGQQ